MLAYAPRKAIKSQILADFVAEWTDTQLPPPQIQAECWTLYFDGSVMKTGAGLLFVSPLGEHMRYAVRLHFPTSNNMAEYVSYGPPWAHYLGGYQDRLLGGPLGLPGLRYTASEGVEHKFYTGVVLG
jgi:hypothetical protein